MPLEHILFPVDFSEACTAVSGYVEALARGSGARLTLLHVVAQMKDKREEQLNQYLEPQLRHLSPVRVVAHGDPATEIVQFAGRDGVGLIMMPTRGTGVFRRLLLGSVTAKVLHDAACPVWTSSHSERITPARFPYRTIACALDLSDRSAETLRWAIRFAAEQNADLRAVHGIDVEEQSTNIGIVEVRRYLGEKASERWEALKGETGFEGPLLIAYGSAGAAVRKAAHDLQADIVITGRGRVQAPFGRLRSNAYAIIRESPCPVISV